MAHNFLVWWFWFFARLQLVRKLALDGFASPDAGDPVHSSQFDTKELRSYDRMILLLK